MMTDRVNKNVLIAGLVLLLAGVTLLVYSYSRAPKTESHGSQTASLLGLLDTAQARFEIGYTMMDLEFYNSNYKRVESGETGLLIYPVFINDVTSRLKLDSPLVKPDYIKMPVADPYLKDFAKYYKNRKLAHVGTSVICLIISQVGMGTADSVILDADQVKIQDAEEIYDALDLGGNDYQQGGIRGGKNKVQKQFLKLGKMETGNSLLIPLCITNMYRCENCNIDPSAWQLASYTAYVPNFIYYRGNKGARDTISLEKSLGLPVYMSR